MQYGGRTRRSAAWAACVLLSRRSQRDAGPAALQATLLNTLPHVCAQSTLSHMGVNDVGVCLYPPNCFSCRRGIYTWFYSQSSTVPPRFVVLIPCHMISQFKTWCLSTEPFNLLFSKRSLKFASLKPHRCTWACFMPANAAKVQLKTLTWIQILTRCCTAVFTLTGVHHVHGTVSRLW